MRSTRSIPIATIRRQTRLKRNQNPESAIEQRTHSERRRRPTGMINPYLFHGQRKGFRRQGEPLKNYYVDRFAPSEWALSILLLALCIGDALMTNYHLGQGAMEANPLLRYFYNTGGAAAMMGVKVGLTLPGLLFLMVHAKFTFCRYALFAMLVVYTCVMVYQSWLTF